MNEEAPTTEEEIGRQYRVIDQMLSMHSILRDRMERRAFWLNTVLVASSLCLTVFVFVGDGLLEEIYLDPKSTRFALGLVAVVILISSITEFRIDWRAVAGRHADAALRLAELKAVYRRSRTDTVNNNPQKHRRLTSEYDKVMSILPPIPDRWFNKLKAEHHFKRLLSVRISQNPTMPMWLLRLQLRGEGLRKVRRVGKESSGG